MSGSVLGVVSGREATWEPSNRKFRGIEGERPKRAMYGRRPRCKRNLTYQRNVRVRPCIRPIHLKVYFFIAMQPLWPLALM